MVDFTDPLKHFPKPQWSRLPTNDKQKEEMVPDLMARYEIVEKE
jgi:hypothetical protein